MTTFRIRDGEAGYRRQNNFRCAYGLVLDFDNGLLSPEEFERIFWHDAGPLGKTSFIICNSFSRSAPQPNRYRVIVPFRNPCPSLELFQLVHDSLVERIRVVTGYGGVELVLIHNVAVGFSHSVFPVPIVISGSGLSSEPMA